LETIDGTNKRGQFLDQNEIGEVYITGTQVNFYFHCQRQLWLFSHLIRTEHESDLVRQGRLVHEQSFLRETKEIELGMITVDFLDVKGGVLHEVKHSSPWSEAHEWQVLYYLYILKSKGVKELIGQIHYPKQKETRSVFLTKEKEEQLIKILDDIQRVTLNSTPPKGRMKKNICSKCSYYEFCWID
jgi:CRISPR-associated exonuclease Cas4